MNKFDINQLKENEIDEKDYKELFLSEELRIKVENVFESLPQMNPGKSLDKWKELGPVSLKDILNSKAVGLKLK